MGAGAGPKDQGGVDPRTTEGSGPENHGGGPYDHMPSDNFERGRDCIEGELPPKHLGGDMQKYNKRFSVKCYMRAPFTEYCQYKQGRLRPRLT